MAWQKRLAEIIERAKGKPADGLLDLDEAQTAVTELIENEVLPAFEELKRELEVHGREARVERSKDAASLRVFCDGDEEFSYAIRGRLYHKMTFAFPELVDDSRRGRLVRAEVVLRGESHDRPVTRMKKQDVIDDFLRSYGKWVGW